MTKNSDLIPREAIERAKSRLLQTAAVKAAEAAKATADAAALDQELVDLEKLATLAAKYNLALTPKEPVPEKAPARPESEAVTLADLIRKYRTSDLSSYKKLRFKTREHYDTVINGILNSGAGQIPLASLEKEDIFKLHDLWTDGGKTKLSMAHGRIAILRIVANFCDETLHDPSARSFSIALHRARIPRLKARVERLTEVQVKQIIAKAHELGRPSIALAQALQFELSINQKDVIGEWVPLEDLSPPTEILMYDSKWVRGLRWEEISDEMELTHTASFNGKLIKANLNEAPLVMNEIAKLKVRPKRGPVIVSEASGAPWVPGEFRRWWRKIANECGIPKTINNRDAKSTSYKRNVDGGLENNRPAAAES